MLRIKVILIVLTFLGAFVWVPDTDTRQEAAHLDPDKIEHLSFSGMYITGTDWGYFDVNDPDLIRAFVRALQLAVISSDDAPPPPIAELNALPPPPILQQERLFLEGAGCIEIYEKGVTYREGTSNDNASLPAPQRFGFFPGSPRQAYGPRFCNALHELAKYEARRVRATAAESISVAFAPTMEAEAYGKDGNPNVVANEENKRTLLLALQEADERIFFLTRPSDTLDGRERAILDFTRRDGKKVRFFLIIAPLRRAYRNPDWHVALLRILEEQGRISLDEYLTSHHLSKNP